jgi:hypothetical protein
MAVVIDGQTLQNQVTFQPTYPGHYLGPPTGSFRGNVGDFTPIVTNPATTVFNGNSFATLTSDKLGVPNTQSAKKSEEQQPGRRAEGPTEEDSDHIGKRSNDEAKKNKKLLQPKKPYKRVKSKTKNDAPKYLGIKDMAKEGQGGANDAGAFLTEDIGRALQGLVQNMSTQIPGMQQLLSMIPNEVFQQFLSNLPPELQSLLPVGTLAGAGFGLENLAKSVSLNGLLQMAAGGALGPEANQLLRTIIPGVNLANAVTQLGNTPFQAVYGQALGMPNSAASNAASVLSNVQQLAGIASSMGIPVNIASLNQAYVIGMQGLGLAQSIPATLNNMSIGTALNTAMGLANSAGIPLLPNIGGTGFNSALLAGLPQNISADLARAMFNPMQLMNMLPANLQNLIPMIAPILANGAENFMQSIANAAPQMAPNSDQPGGGNGDKGCQHVDPLNDGKTNEDTRYIDYTQMLSKNYSLYGLTLGSGVESGKNMIHGDKIAEKVKNLSALSENVLEPLRKKYPAFTIISGWREEGEGHKDGKAVDVAWVGDPGRLLEISNYIQKTIPAAEVQMNKQKIGWLHIKYDKDKCGSKASTQTPGGQQADGIVEFFKSSGLF